MTKEQSEIREVFFKTLSQVKRLFELQGTRRIEFVYIKDEKIETFEDNKYVGRNRTSYQKLYNEEEVLDLLISCKDRFGGSELWDQVDDKEVKEWFKNRKNV